jgi:hydrogenase expression/formation protein HypC
MCLGVPGRILSLETSQLGIAMGRVSFGGIVKEVCMAYTPDAVVGEYVIVHVGFAISTIDEAEAVQVFEYLGRIGELDELTAAETAAAADATAGAAVRGATANAPTRPDA